MPRKSKDESKKSNKQIAKTTTIKVKESNLKKSKTSKSVAKEVNVKDVSKKAAATSVAKASKSATATSPKLNTITKAQAATKKVAAKEKTTSKKATTKKAATSNRKTAKKTATTKKTIKLANVEYYDLPYRYNETTVKILAQTPTTLFIYWDISDEDRASFLNKYGKDFFENTKPILIVTNKTMHYSFEVEINDFANSWYLHVNDADCDYVVELGRKPVVNNSNIDNFVHVSSSNDMEVPNNHILFDKLGKSVFFKNVKNNFVEKKEISSLSFIKNVGKLYGIYELYKELYKDEINVEELSKNNIRLNLSSSSSSPVK